MYPSSPKSALRLAVLSICTAAIALFSGCAGFTTTAAPSGHQVSSFGGRIHGGEQPISGAHVYLLAANSAGGYGSASSSLLVSTDPGTATDSVGTYVTTDANGSFTYAGTWTCPTPGTLVYLLATGGNPGLTAGTQNTAISLTAALGACSNITSSTYTWINEVTTVAMAFALEPFMLDASHVGSPSSNSAGLINAFATVPNLVNNTTGIANTTPATGFGVAPQQYVNTLANIVAPCVNSASSTSAACAALFSASTSTNTGTPTNTLGALLNIAAFPGTQVAGLYALPSGVAPFQPALTTQPNDFALGITYNAGFTVVQPSAVVIDASGNIWMANCQSCLNPTAPDSLIEFSPDGVFLHSYTGSSVAGTQVLHMIKGIAIDSTGTYIYTVNQGISGGPAGGIGDDQLIKMSTASGTVQSGFPVDFDQATYGVDTFNGIALDNSGEIWATATNAGAIVEVTPNGNLINGSPFFIGGTLGVATDNIGNIWFAGIAGNNIVQFDTNGDFLNNFTPAGLSQPASMAINGSNELITINQGTQSLSKVEFFNGNNGSGSPYTGIGIFSATVTAIDGANQTIIPNCRASCPSSGSTQPDNVLRLTQNGVPDIGGSAANFGAQVPTLSGASGAAIDASGNVWVANNLTGTITQLIGFASPTIQPLAAAAANGKIGQLP